MHLLAGYSFVLKATELFFGCDERADVVKWSRICKVSQSHTENSGDGVLFRNVVNIQTEVF